MNSFNFWTTIFRWAFFAFLYLFFTNWRSGYKVYQLHLSRLRG